jgi:hypothetical protein
VTPFALPPGKTVLPALDRGRRLNARATDPAGNSSPLQSRNFTIVR